MENADEYWMGFALEQAHIAEAIAEVPVGACLVGPDGSLIAAASNRTITDTDPTAHAEVLVLREAASKIGNYRLLGTTMYSTVEPCAMCAGALVNARVSRLVYGTVDERFGAADTHFRICDSPVLNHRIEVSSGVRAEECRLLMQEFFRSRRRSS